MGETSVSQWWWDPKPVGEALDSDWEMLGSASEEEEAMPLISRRDPRMFFDEHSATWRIRDESQFEFTENQNASADSRDHQNQVVMESNTDDGIDGDNAGSSSFPLTRQEDESGDADLALFFSSVFPNNYSDQVESVSGQLTRKPRKPRRRQTAIKHIQMERKATLRDIDTLLQALCLDKNHAIYSLEGLRRDLLWPTLTLASKYNIRVIKKTDDQVVLRRTAMGRLPVDRMEIERVLEEERAGLRGAGRLFSRLTSSSSGKKVSSGDVIDHIVTAVGDDSGFLTMAEIDSVWNDPRFISDSQAAFAFKEPVTSNSRKGTTSSSSTIKDQFVSRFTEEKPIPRRFCQKPHHHHRKPHSRPRVDARAELDAALRDDQESVGGWLADVDSEEEFRLDTSEAEEIFGAMGFSSTSSRVERASAGGSETTTSSGIDNLTIHHPLFTAAEEDEESSSKGSSDTLGTGNTFIYDLNDTYDVYDSYEQLPEDWSRPFSRVFHPFPIFSTDYSAPSIGHEVLGPGFWDVSHEKADAVDGSDGDDGGGLVSGESLGLEKVVDHGSLFEREEPITMPNLLMRSSRPARLIYE